MAAAPGKNESTGPNDHGHKQLLLDFQVLGCADLSKCALAARVYHDQIKDGRTANVQTLFDAELDLLYVTGLRAGVSFIFLPILSCQDFDLLQVDRMQAKLAPHSNSITLAICDTSSNILYYPMMAGFVERKEQSSF